MHNPLVTTAEQAAKFREQEWEAALARRPRIVGTISGTGDTHPLIWSRNPRDGYRGGMVTLYAWSDGVVTWTEDRQFPPVAL